MERGRGVPYVGRVLDACNRPVVGARVEGFEGCSHAPSLLVATTDCDGVFRFSIDPDPGRELRLSIVVPGFEAPWVHSRQEGLGERPQEIVLRPAPVFRGVVFDAGAHPLRGAVVRGESAGGRSDGPWATTDDDGAFTLD